MLDKKSLYLRGVHYPRNRGIRFTFGGLFAFVVVLVNYLVFFRGSADTEPSLEQRLARPEETVEIPQTPVDPPASRVVEGILSRGESASQALSRLGVPPAHVSAVLAALAKHVDMRSLKVGQKFVLTVDSDGGVKSLIFPIDETNYLEVTNRDNGYEVEKREVPTSKEVIRIACMLKGSLFESLQRCGEDPSLASVISDLLSSQIDFFTDSRRGDVLRIIIEKESLGGRFLRYGKVLGLIYEGRVVSLSVFPLESDGKVLYYTADGESVERPFLRSPLKYTRISSEFSLRRLHPILHTYTPHRALDYAAPKGTPVYAVGDGKIVFAGPKGNSGKLVVIQHPNGYQTYYAHLSHFVKGLKSGDTVTKHSLIGFVGSSGRSTGPHLHFAVAKDGVFIHPRKLLEHRGPKLPPERESEFKTYVGRTTAELKSLPVRGIDGTRS